MYKKTGSYSGVVRILRRAGLKLIEQGQLEQALNNLEFYLKKRSSLFLLDGWPLPTFLLNDIIL